MSAEKLKRYRFASKAQWSHCLFARVDQATLQKTGAVGGLPHYILDGHLFESDGARATVMTRAGDILWLDNHNDIHRAIAGLEAPATFPAPAAMAAAKRIVAAAGGLWVKGTSPDSLQRFDDETFARTLTVDLHDAQVHGIAGGGRNFVAVLVERDRRCYVIRVDRDGRTLDRAVELRGACEPAEFVYLTRAQRYIVLTKGPRQRLLWFAMKGGSSLIARAVTDDRPCFTATCLATDGKERVLVAGTDFEIDNANQFVMVFDGDGSFLIEQGVNSNDAPVEALAASRDRLLIAGPHGLRECSALPRVPEGAGPVGSEIMTPVLFSPDREDRRRWLRVEAEAKLPAGSTLEISWMATDDDPARSPLGDVAQKKSIPAARRIAAIKSDSTISRGGAIYHGSAAVGAPAEKFMAQLFDVNARYLWVHIALTTASGGELPQLLGLEVLYPGHTLMEHLPGIFQREMSRQNSFLRSLVGVLETTTQGIDSRIETLGQLLDPAVADEKWLNFVARWLGVPWDDALPEDKKRAILTRASDLAEWRGTRKGLETLLECLVGDSPRRFRVDDATADHGFAVVGGPACVGSALPAMLGGRPQWGAQLDSTAVLGFTRLPCPESTSDGLLGLTGRIRVAVAATGQERHAWDPWFRPLLNEMVPLGARIEFAWLAPAALRSNRLDGTLTLGSEPAPHLGDDAIAGRARFSDRGLTLSAGGPIIGTHLR